MKCKDNENGMQDNGMEWKARSMLGSQRIYLQQRIMCSEISASVVVGGQRKYRSLITGQGELSF